MDSDTLNNKRKSAESLEDESGPKRQNKESEFSTSEITAESTKVGSENLTEEADSIISQLSDNSVLMEESLVETIVKAHTLLR